MLPKTKQLRTGTPDAEFKASVAEHVRDVVAILSGKFSLENMNVQQLSIDVTGDDEAVRVKTRFQSEPLWLGVGPIRNLSNADVPGVYVPAWRFIEGHVYLYNFATLTSGVKYSIPLIVLGGG